MKIILLSLFLLSSCNIMKALTDGETKIDENFYNGSQGVNLGDGLISFWKLDESSGISRQDSGYNGNDMTVTSSMNSISIGGRTGIDCNSTTTSVNFLDDVVSGPGLSFGTHGNFAVSFWIYRLATPATDLIIFELSNFIIKAPSGDNSAIQFDFNAGSYQTWANFGLATTGWNHVAVNLDRTGGFYVYLNGSLFNHDATTSTGSNMTNSVLRLCSTGGNGTNKFEGYLDSVGVWNRSLNTDEIKALYNGQNHLD
jgi:hypothetical protein